ncbi:peptidoglycan endopeptidase EnpA [Enterococcus faecalis]|jgi:murein DD-endopeptidase MepM/ murein hydrolase activator NlpD/SLT domain-containing protein|uniref:peptidoglycan endopeptidase EnpA n=1 Tax=Enterococcus faecalis TaxID=1351 RepID=UPI000D37FEC3|nr:peptidoglycan endopeptidase EnpA [Enterococcus faecalis]EGO6069644.1 peptidoglycan DD-metalloendopeptidase family protein [Enterococcus faecalis]EJX8006345.1 peptidoglycan endopeptidase EnpA [Enterococcus faecalis]EJZ8459371.1 peptidoglycan endopeptidase EnpA [Enterococcus faecalis]PUA24105.1 peptidase M23 [Enterococcus faecalis]QZT50898.1 peptidoglycan endopeptidase EnpA [Enterococcus faecalis]
MADALRSSVIELDWKINNRSLERANEETDKILAKAARMEGTYQNSAKSIDGATTSLKRNSEGLKQNTDKVVQFGNRAKDSMQKTTNSAKQTEKQVKDVGNQFDKSKNSASVFAQSSATSLKVVGKAAKGVQTSIGHIGTVATKASDVAWNAFTKIRNGAMIAGAAIAGAGKKAFDYASDTNEALNKVEVAFGDNNKVVEDWSKSTLTNIGLAQGTALDLAATYGDMSTSMGIGTEEAAKMSTSLVDLAGDLASFKNIGIDRVNTALNGVFTGETEALKGLGIVMTQTNLEQFAMASGALQSSVDNSKAAKNAMAREKAQDRLNKAIKKHGENSIEARDAQLKLTEAESKGEEVQQAKLDSLSQEELVRLRYNYVMSKTKNSQGDFARTSDQAANATRVFTESIKETSAKLGQGLLPIFTPLIIKATDFVKKGEEIPDMLENVGAKIEPTAKQVIRYFGQAKDYFIDEVIPTAKKVGKAIGPGIAEGAKDMFNLMDKGFKYIIKPGIRVLKEFTDENPVAMKQVGKWAAYGIGGLLGFKLIGKPLLGVSKGILGIIGKLEKLGNTAQREAFKTRKALEDVDSAAQKASAPTHTTASPSIQESLPVGSVGKIGKGTKLFGGVRRFAKSVPLLSYISAGLTLTQINKNNKFEKIGDSLGSIVGGALGAKAATLAGAKLGAAAGTTFGPLGTLIGGVLGTAAGSIFGSKFGKKLQEKWPDISKKISELWESSKDNFLLGPLVQGIDKAVKKSKSGIKEIKASAKDLFKKPFDNTTKSGNGVSKATAKRMNSFMKNYELLVNQDTTGKIEGRVLTNEEVTKRYKALEDMQNQVTKQLDKKKDKSNSNLDKLAGMGILNEKDAQGAKAAADELAKVRTNMFSEKVQDFKKLEKQEYDESITATEYYTNRINEIKEKARLENRELSENDKKEIESLEKTSAAAVRAVEEKHAAANKSIHEDMKNQAVVALSDSAKEQKIIMGNLKNASGEISAQQAADAVAASYKAKEGTIKSANEKYEETKRILDEERYVNGTITQQQYDDALKKAQEQRDGVVKEAEKQHEDVVTQAKKQAEGHLEQVDWETGQTLSKWEVFKKDSKKKFKEIWDGTVEGAKSFGKAFGEAMDKVVSGALETWDNFKTGLADKVNAVTGGINVVLDFFSIPKIPEWKPNTPNSTKNKHGRSFSSGSRGASYSGQALVGEEGVELAYNKSTSSMRLLGSNGPEVTNVTSGERILNHSDTKAVLNGGMGQGTVLPGFHKGKGNGLSDFVDSAKDFGANTVDKIKDFGSNAVDKAKEVGTKAIEKTKDIAETAKDWLSDPIGKVTGLFNKHNTYKNGKNIQGLGYGVMNKLKDTSSEWVKNKLEAFKGFFDSEDGGAFGSGAFAPHFGSPFVRTSDYGKRPGLYGDFHTGIDYAAPTGTPIPAQYPGLVDWVQSSSIGLGEHVGIKVADNLWAMYGHMSRIRAKMGDKVKAGQIVGDVGSSGWSTGPHVHYELRKGGPNGQHVNPDTYGGAAGGVAVGAAGWGPQVRKAAKQMNQQVSDAEVNGILAQIQRESSGNQSIIQSSAVWDVNTASGNPARGLLQYIPQTFDAYKVRGYENIMNGFHQLMAFFNNSNWRTDLPYGHSGWGPTGHRLRAYAKGGRPSKGETVLVGEDGPELFEADTAGTVHPHEKTKALFNQGSPSVNFSPNITINVGNNSDKSVVGDIKEAVRQALEDEYAKLLNILGTGEVV